MVRTQTGYTSSKYHRTKAASHGAAVAAIDGLREVSARLKANQNECEQLVLHLMLILGIMNTLPWIPDVERKYKELHR